MSWLAPGCHAELDVHTGVVLPELAALLERASTAGVAMGNDGRGVLKKGQHFGLKVRVGVGSHSKLARRRGKPGRGGGGARRGGAEASFRLGPKPQRGKWLYVYRSRLAGGSIPQRGLRLDFPGFDLLRVLYVPFV